MFLKYSKTELRRRGSKEACLVVFHAEELVQLLHEIILKQMDRDFLDIFGSYIILEDEVRYEAKSKLKK